MKPYFLICRKFLADRDLLNGWPLPEKYLIFKDYTPKMTDW